MNRYFTNKLLLAVFLIFSSGVFAHEYDDPNLIPLTDEQERMADAYLLGKLDVYLLAGYNSGDLTIFEPYMCFYSTIYDEYWEPYVFNIRHFLTHGGYTRKRYRVEPEPYILTLRRMALETFGCGEWNYFMPYHPEYYE